MKLKYVLIHATMLSIALSGTALAKKPEGKGKPHIDGPDARWENSNRQSDDHSLRGQDRAEERHHLKESKKYKQKKDKKYKHKKEKYHDKYDKKHDKYDRRDKNKYYDSDNDRYEEKHDHYERQRYKERYQNNPVDTVINHNIDGAKSIIDDTHRKTIESIDNKSRELTGNKTRKDRTNSARPWWSIFGEE